RVSGFANAYFQPRIMADLRTESFDYLMNHSYSFFANNFGGALVQRLNRLSRAFERFSDRIIWDLFPLIIRVIGVTIVLATFNRTVALLMVCWTIVFIAVNYVFSTWKLKYDIKRAAKDSETTAVLADAITNYNTIQLFTGFVFESKFYKKVSEEWRKLITFTWNLNTILDSVESILFFGIEFFLFYYGVKYWQKGIITVGGFVLIQSYLLQLVHRLWDFGRLVRDIYSSFADASEMVEILEMAHEIRDIPTAKKIKVSQGEIKFINMCFSFNKTREVLKGINLTIKPGERVAFIGPSGAGKSTFAKLIFRLYDLDSGEILIDNQNIAKVTQESLRSNISLVPQDPILFHRTLMANIRYGRRDASDEEVREVAKLAHCEEFVNNLPLGYQTYVGERGIKLSGGERQRVAIARAMLKNAPILILDEATSSLDSYSEALIQDALARLMEGKTVIVVAHRLSTIRKVDRIIVLDEGRITEEGSHEELLKNHQSLYYKLWNLQAGGFIGGE
ncbi:MAG: ABC transporter ATP-binding protein, partial [bacterium]